MTSNITHGLTQLEMYDNQHTLKSLVPVKYAQKAKIDYAYYQVNDYSTDEIIALEKAAKYQANYIYFRRFPNRPPLAQIYIYDSTNQQLGRDDLKELHKKLWNAIQVPLFFVFQPKEVVIFNCFEKPEKQKKLIYKPLETIHLAAEVLNELNEREIALNLEKLKAFSGKQFDNGSFWENSPYSLNIKFSGSSYERLIVELRNVLKDIVAKNDLPKSIAKRLLVIGILIRYLEERTDKEGHSVFPKKGEKRKFYHSDGTKEIRTYQENFFENFATNAQCLTDVLKSSKQESANLQHPFINLLEYLSKHFNGEIFKLSKEEKKVLLSLDDSRFEHLAYFFEGKLEGKQFVLWNLYSFNDLPIELISNIYEEFLESKSEGVVYTPPFLVNLLLDEVLPFDDKNTEVKILDPACGSGIFLVGAYKRLIGRWRAKNGWNEPALTDLKKLLKQNIFGADIQEEAVRLAIFSLNLAMCDNLSPVAIWEHLEFENLQKDNLFDKDFFTLLENKRLPNDFDLVIGNPPFKSSLTASAKAIEIKEREERIKLVEGKEQQINVPDNQIALLFLEQSMKLCKEGGWMCLIMPSGPFLYNIHSLDFRRHLLSKYHCPQIFDFTHLSRVLFGKNGDVATAAAFFQHKAPFQKGLQQITFRRIKQAKEKILFDLNTYDFHYIPLEVAKNEPLVWKANFLGGGRILSVLSKFQQHRKLGDFFDEKGWIVKEGFTPATSNDKLKLKNLIRLGDIEKLEKFKDKLEANFIENKKLLPTNAFKPQGINNNQIKEHSYTLFHSKGDPLIYEAPHLLIKEIVEENTNFIPIEYREDELAFKNSIIGIYANGEHNELIKIENRFKHNSLYAFVLAGFSGRYLVNKSSSLLKTDIEKLPYAENLDDLALNEIEQILVDDFLEYLLPFRRNGEKSAATKPVQAYQLEQFAETYCLVLNTVYKNLKPYPTYVETDTFIAYAFYFGEKPNLDFEDTSKAEKNLTSLVYEQTGQHIRMTRVIRMYEGNVIYLIKPKQLRFWLRSIAVRDADETFADLRRQGY